MDIKLNLLKEIKSLEVFNFINKKQKKITKEIKLSHKSFVINEKNTKKIHIGSTLKF